MRRELQDEQSGWGKQIKEEWKKMGVRSVKQCCCEKVEERGWLASKIGEERRGRAKIAKELKISGATQCSSSNGRV